MRNFLVVIENAGGNFSAYSPDVPGCVTTGATIDATLANMREALMAHLDLMAADGDTLPEAHGLEFHLRAEPEILRNPEVVFAHLGSNRWPGGRGHVTYCVFRTGQTYGVRPIDVRHQSREPEFQSTRGPGRRTEDRGRRTEDGGQRAEGRRRRPDARAGGRRRRLDLDSFRTENGSMNYMTVSAGPGGRGRPIDVRTRGQTRFRWGQSASC